MTPTVGAPSSASLGGMALVVVQDVEYLDFVQRVIQGVGYGVKVCNSYTEGISHLSARGFDLIVVGQGSPQFEGRCVLERAAELDRQLPVIVVARILDMACYIEAMQLGAVDYIAGHGDGVEIARVVKNFAPRSKGNLATLRQSSNAAS